MFRTILCFVALVFKSYFFQKSHYAEIIQHQILIQTLQFLTRLPTRQDGVKNRDKVYTLVHGDSYLVWKNNIIA